MIDDDNLARIYPCCNSMLIALERPQPSSWLFLPLMVRAGYVCDAIILRNHRTLTWTTGSLPCPQMLMHATAHGGVRTPKKSLHWKLTLGRKSFAAPGNLTCISGVTVRCSNQLSYIPSPKVTYIWIQFKNLVTTPSRVSPVCPCCGTSGCH